MRVFSPVAATVRAGWAGLFLGCGGSQPAPDVGMATDTGMATDAGTATDSGMATDGLPPPECAPVVIPVLNEPGERSFEPLATRAEIPGLADQPTATGQILRSLAAFDGRLHLGYGDYSQNTGPIPMFAFEPASAQFIELGILSTEQVTGLVHDGTHLYASAVDPVGHQAEGGAFRLPCGDSGWLEGAAISGAVHVYGTTVFEERIYVGTGSLEGQPARLMSSADAGASWDEEFRQESPAGRFTRFYYLGGKGTQFFVSGHSQPAPVESFAWVRESGTFVSVSGVPDTGYLAPVVFADRMVVAHTNGDTGAGRHLGTFALEADILVPTSPFPTVGSLAAWSISPGLDPTPSWLWVLMVDAETTSLHRSGDFESWEEVATVPAAPAGDRYTSMAILLNDAYLGTAAGTLMVLGDLDRPAG